jgi:hypothetical protein
MQNVSGGRAEYSEQGEGGNYLYYSGCWKRMQRAERFEHIFHGQHICLGNCASDIRERFQKKHHKDNTSRQKDAERADQQVLQIDVSTREQRQTMRHKRKRQAQQEEINGWQ